MQITLPTASIKSALTAAAKSALSAEQQLAAGAEAQLQAYVDSIAPLAIAQTQALVTATDPAVAQGYLAVLQGACEAKIVELGLAALAVQKQQVAANLMLGVQILAMVLKAAVAA